MLPAAESGRTPAVAEGGAASASDGPKADENATAGNTDINDGFADGCQRVAEDVPNAKRQKKAASTPAAAPAPLEAGEKERCWREGWAAAILCFETRELVSFKEKEGIL